MSPEKQTVDQLEWVWLFKNVGATTAKAWSPMDLKCYLGTDKIP